MKIFYRIFFSEIVLITAAFSTMAQAPLSHLTKHVNPFIGTRGDGNIFAGACLPHGFVKLGPDCKYSSGASGYKHNKDIKGFSHLHISGMGGPMYGNIQLLPSTGPVETLNHFSPPSDETAAPGYYAVSLNKYHTKAELTATAHVGFHRYTFPQSKESHILVDVGATLYGISSDWKSSMPIGGEVHIDSEAKAVFGYGTFKGGRSTTKPWRVYFYALFDTGFGSVNTWQDSSKFAGRKEIKGNEIGAIIDFHTDENQHINIKVGISMVSSEDARQSISKEIPDWDFEKVRKDADQKWEKELDKIEVAGISEKDIRIFYTALYHANLNPSDWTGQNPVLDKNAVYYEDFLCLWDLYRGVLPLQALINTKAYTDMLNTLLGFYDRDGWLPDAHSSLQREFTQVGTSTDMLFADAYLKKIKGINFEKAYEAIRKNGADTSFRFGKVVHSGRVALPDYQKYHFVPLDTSRSPRKNAVSKSLEYAYGDFSIYQMAKGLGKKEDAKMFLERSLWYKNLWDSDTKKMRGKFKDGSWIAPFQPAKYESGLSYYEGNAYTWTYFVPHDVGGLIKLFGGKTAFSDSLSNAVNNHYEAFNEPGMLEIYLFIWAGRPDLTQKYLRQVLVGSFNDTDNGLPGNDDSGATSSWYLWSRMGIYPVAGQNLYVIGSPSHPKTIIHLESGIRLLLLAKNASEKNIYIQSAKLNGKPYNKSFFTQEEIRKGAKFEFIMGPKPSDWGRNMIPPSSSDLAARSL